METEYPPSQSQYPHLISTSDAVGEKLKVAMMMDCHDTIGADCVANCTNTLVCAGARPVLFRDCISIGENGAERANRAVEGIRRACLAIGCPFEETPLPEPDALVSPEEYRLSGFSVGFREKNPFGKPSNGDVVIGVASSGVHTGGFSLIRRVLGNSMETLEMRVPELSGTVGEELLTPVKLYAPSFLAVRDTVQVKSVAYVSEGLYGGFRTLAGAHSLLRIESSQIAVPPIFDLIARTGDVSQREMFEHFNMGLGLLFVTSTEDADKALETLFNYGEQGWVIGQIAEGHGIELI